MWRFLISYSKKTKHKSETIDIINSIGKMPEKAPEIVFETEKECDPFEDFDSNFEDFDK